MRFDNQWTQAILRSKRDLTPGIREFTLAPEGGASPYPTGAHVVLRVIVDGKQDLRRYSLVGEQPADGGLGEEADGQVGDGDAHLGARQLRREVAQRREGSLSAAVAALGVALDGGPVDRQQGELRGHEAAAGHHQRGGGQQEEDLGHRRAPARGAVGAGRRVRAGSSGATGRRSSRGACPAERGAGPG